MKDLKFPKEDRFKTIEAWENLKPGDEIYLIEWSMWRQGYIIEKLNVVRITPKGNIRLSDETLVKLENCYNCDYYIPTKELQEWVSKILLEEIVLRLINDISSNNKIFKENTTYEEYIKLSKILTNKTY